MVRLFLAIVLEFARDPTEEVLGLVFQSPAACSGTITAKRYDRSVLFRLGNLQRSRPYVRYVRHKEEHQKNTAQRSSENMAADENQKASGKDFGQLHRAHMSDGSQSHDLRSVSHPVTLLKPDTASTKYQPGYWSEQGSHLPGMSASR
jgi:hypothetical protein